VSDEFKTGLYNRYMSTHILAGGADVRGDLEVRAPYLRRFIRDWIGHDRGLRILDLGCGYGAVLFFLKEAGYRNLTGVDTSAEQVAAATGLALDCVRLGDLLETLRAAAPGSCDVIIAFDILEHFPKRVGALFVEQAFRALANGGRFAVHVPNAEGIFPARVFFGDLTHETCFTRQSLGQMLRMAGFRYVRFAEDSPVPHGLRSLVRYLGWKCARALFRLIYVFETGDTDPALVLSQNILAIADK
jgi:SAM-dependent methyltransferase